MALPPLLLRSFRILRGVALAAVVLAAGGAAAFLASTLPKSSAAPAHSGAEVSPVAEQDRKITRSGSDGLVVPVDIATKMGLKVVMLDSSASAIPLPPFQGSLALDAERLVRARSRFAGEVVEIGYAGAKPGGSVVQVGDKVSKGDLLAVVWSKDLGEKKNELVDALCRLKLDRDSLARYKGLSDGIVAQKQLREAEAAVRAGENAVAKAEATLRSWRLSDAEIANVATKADAIDDPDARRELAADPTWARVEVRAAADGEVLEKNVATGDMVDTSVNLFVIGDVTKLAVWVHVYEEDLNLLRSLPQPSGWKVSLPSRPGVTFAGTLGHIAAVIDPAQHTALVRGMVGNSNGELKAGQAVTVTVELPRSAAEFALPTDAVVEDGRDSVVFLQPNPAENRFVRQPVTVVRRFRDTVYVRATDDISPGHRVVTLGSLLLWQAFDQLPAIAAK